MTDLRKAAEMALEALEDASERLSLEFTGRSEYKEEIAALRQTLSQLEREQHCRYCNGIGRVVCDGRCLPKQEPVSFEDWLKNQHGDPEEIGFLQALRITYYAGADSHTAPPSKQEPYCWVQSKLSQGMFYKEKPRRIHTIPLYAAPPSKPWVSLTDEDFDNIYKRYDTYDLFACAIEAKLKEKNI